MALGAIIPLGLVKGNSRTFSEKIMCYNKENIWLKEE